MRPGFTAARALRRPRYRRTYVRPRGMGGMDSAPPSDAEKGRHYGGAGAPSDSSEECNAGVSLPERGTEFTGRQVCERFGVKKRGRIRVNHESRIVVLVDGADAPARGKNAGRGEYLEFGGHGVDAQSGMRSDDIALANSRRDGYKVLYFAKRRGRLRFEGLVECTHHTPPGDVRPGRKISFRLGPIKGARSGSARLFPIAITPESLDRVVDCLARSGMVRADGEAIQLASGSQQAAAKDAEDVESCIETLEILADPDLVEQIRESEADLRAGRVVPWVGGRAQNVR